MALELKTQIVENIRRGVVGVDYYGLPTWLYRFYLGLGRTGVKDQYYDTLSYASLNWTTLFPEFLYWFGLEEHVFVGDVMDERIVE